MMQVLIENHVLRRRNKKETTMHTKRNVEGESLQKRSYYRLPCHIPVTFNRLCKTEPRQLLSDEAHEGIICNISGGGVKLSTALEMHTDDRIFFPMQIDGCDLYLMGEIRRSQHTGAAENPASPEAPEAPAPNTNTMRQYGVMFVGISELDRDKIIRYLFQQQKQRVRN